MANKRANLLIDVSKNIIEQYRNQLAETIEYNKRQQFEKYTYDGYVKIAEKFLETVNKILSDYEKSIFDGVITQDMYSIASSKEENDLSEIVKGIKKLFYYIGIPDYSMYPIIADIIKRFQKKNDVDNQKISISEKLNNDLFDEDGKYNVGELKYNDKIFDRIVPETGALNTKIPYGGTRHLFYIGQDKFILDTIPIYNIIKKYIEDIIKENNVSVDEQNKIIKEAIDTFMQLKPTGSDRRIKYSGCFEIYFNELEKNPIKDFYLDLSETKADIVNDDKVVNDENSSQIEEYKEVKDKIAKLSDLTKEEQELYNRLLEIKLEKEEILNAVKALDNLENKETNELPNEEETLFEIKPPEPSEPPIIPPIDLNKFKKKSEYIPTTPDFPLREHSDQNEKNYPPHFLDDTDELDGRIRL